MATVTLEKSRPMWWRSSIALSVYAVIFGALFKTMDNINVHTIFLAPDDLTEGLAYLVVGGWTLVLVVILVGLAFGRWIFDPDFRGIILNNKPMHTKAMISGGIGAVATLFLLLGNQLGDPTMLIALGNGALFYTATYEVMAKRANSSIVKPAALVLLGGLMAAYGLSLPNTVLGFFFVLVISNGLSAFGEIKEQEGIRASDSVNLLIWRFVWLATFGTAMALLLSLSRGLMPLLAETILKAKPHLAWIVFTMFVVVLGMGFKFAAKKIDLVSKVLIVLSTQIVLGYVFTFAASNINFGNSWIGRYVHPGVFGELPTDPLVWAIRVAGSLLILGGILALPRENSSTNSEPG